MTSEDFKHASRIVESYAHRLYADPQGRLNGDIKVESFASHPKNGWKAIFSWIGIYASEDDIPVLFVISSDGFSTKMLHYEGGEATVNPEIDLKERGMWREC